MLTAQWFSMFFTVMVVLWAEVRKIRFWRPSRTRTIPLYSPYMNRSFLGPAAPGALWAWFLGPGPWSLGRALGPGPWALGPCPRSDYMSVCAHRFCFCNSQSVLVRISHCTEGSSSGCSNAVQYELHHSHLSLELQCQIILTAIAAAY